MNDWAILNTLWISEEGKVWCWVPQKTSFSAVPKGGYFYYLLFTGENTEAYRFSDLPQPHSEWQYWDLNPKSVSLKSVLFFFLFKGLK